MMALGLVVPLLVAAVVALRFRRWSRLVVLAALLPLCGVWIAVPRSAASEHIVWIAETADRIGDASRLWLGHASSLSVQRCAAIVMGTPSPPAAQELAWRDACAGFDAASAARVTTPADALRLVVQDVAARGRLRRLYDWAVGHRTRALFLVSDPGEWQRARWSIDVARELAALHAVGIAIDVLETGAGAAAGGPPRLAIAPRQPSLPAVGAQSERYRFDLSLRGEPNPDLVRTVQRVCALDGECVADPECGPGSRCMAGACVGPDGTCRGEPCATRVPPPWWLAPADAEVVPEPGDRTALRTRAPISLAAFSGSYPLLQQGWHPLRCRASYASRTQGPVVVDATTYVASRLPQLVVVQGAGGALRLTPTADRASTERADLEDVIRDRIIQRTDSVASTIFQSPLVLERELAVQPARSPGHGPCLDPAQCESAKMLVVNDATTAFWQAYCPWILARVEQGMNLVISGAPPDVAACASLPVHGHVAALATAIGGERGGRIDWFDRQPRVTFVLDPSRVGHLRYRPRGPASLAQLDKLSDGFAAQGDVVKAVVETDPEFRFDATTGAITHTRSDPAHRPFRSFAIADLGLPWSAYHVAPGDEGQPGMQDSSFLAERVSRWLARAPDEHRFGIGDVVVVFGYELAQPPRTTRSRLAHIAARGARVIVVPLASPFASQPLVAAVTSQLTPRVDGPFARQGRSLDDRVEVLPAIDLANATATGVEHATRDILQRLHAQDDVSRMRVQVTGLGRFIDERALTGGRPVPVALPVTVPWAAPLRFQRLDVRTDRPVLELMQLVEDRPGRTLAPIALGYGSLLGRGHVLTLGYSIFEGAGRDFPFAVPWLDDPAARLNAPGRPDLWGPRRILDLGWLTAQIEPLPSQSPRVVAIDVEAERTLVFTVRQLMDKRTTFESMHLRPARADAASPDCTHDDRSIDLVLRALHPEQHTVAFELPLSSWERACPHGPCTVLLCRRSCIGAQCQEPIASSDPIFLQAPAHHASSMFDDIAVLDQLRTLAMYSGGGAGLELTPLSRSNRPVAVVGVSAVMALLWSQRLLRRIRGRRRARPAVEGTPDTIANARGYLREIGEALGSPATDLAAGAVAGVRPIDPGEQLRSAVRQDVLVMAGLAGPDLAGSIRVLQRIDERTRRLLVVVHVGASMQIPRERGRSDKLRAAAMVCEVLAEIVWATRGEVRLALVHGSTVSAPLVVAPGGPHPAEAILAHASQRRGWQSRLPHELVGPGDTVVYVSDYLNENLDQLARSVEDIEADGSPTGFVHIVSSSEHHLTDFGIHPHSGSVLDRSELAARELGEAYERFGHELDARLDHASGGVLHVRSPIRAAELVVLVRTSRLLPFLR